MLDNLINTLEKYSPKQLAFFFIGLAVFSTLIEKIFAVVTGIKYLPIHDISMHVLYAIFFIWIWNIAVIRNSWTIQLSNNVFKICFWLFITFKSVEFLTLIDSEFLDHSLMRTDGFFSLSSISRSKILALSLKGVFIYMVYFTAKVCHNLIQFYNPEYDVNNHLKYGILLFFFPIGIPIIHHDFIKFSIYQKMQQKNKTKTVHSSAQLHTEYKQIKRASYDKVNKRRGRK